ncbi:hypothetical protein, partial [Mycolicibacter heraklionensis]|uniref:hypothetical protein n=1 Tax=Mycolicibacter heraklionensis TaxID=512402 RepID=UPI001A96D8BE
MATVLGAVAAREQVCAALDAIDAAQAVLRATPTDLVGNTFRIDRGCQMVCVGPGSGRISGRDDRQGCGL